MFLNDKDRAYLIDRFRKEMKNKVDLILFTQSIDCEYCPETEQLMKELAETSDKINLVIKNFAVDKQDVDKFGIDKVPAIIVGNERIRYFGIPAGYEFSVLIEDIIEVSKSEPLLSADSVGKLSSIKTPLYIKVFVTPTCPYCPRMVKYVHSAALVNPNIKGDMIEATEFPDLAVAYSVYAVPKTVINDKFEIEGAVSEEMFVQELLKAAGVPE